MGTIYGRQPVAIAAFLAIVINLAVSFGLNLSATQIALLNALIVAGLAIIVHESVFAPASTQKIADAATFLPAGTTVDIGNPPEGKP